MQKLSIGLVGYGSWGKKLFKALQKTRSINTVALCDTSHQAIDELGPLRSGIKFITNKYQEFLSSKDIDAVVVATPADTHYQIAMDSLKAGKHVLLEKPMTLDKTQARMLYKLADKKKLILMVDHTYLYAPEIRVAKQMIDSGSLGNIRLIEITRVGPGQYKNDCDVIWDFAPHDLSILYYLRGIPIELSAMNSSHLSRYHIDVSNIYFKFVDGCEARVHLSWLSPIKIRKILVVGSKKTLLLEQYNTNTKIHIYPNAYYFKGSPLTISEGRLVKNIRQMSGLPYSEPLRNVLNEFVQCTTNNSQPLSNGHMGYEIVNIIEKVQHLQHRSSWPGSY